jgi:hypothetical protein
MPLKGGFEALHELAEKVEELAKQRVIRRVRAEIAKTIEQLVRQSFTDHKSPKGISWTGTTGERLTMQRTGELMRSLKITVSEQGVSVELSGKTLPGRKGSPHTVASVQSFGGLIVPGFTKRSRHGAKAVAALAAKASGKGLMRFKTSRGWRTAYSTHHEANPVIPWGGSFPEPWAEAIEAAIKRALEGA